MAKGEISQRTEDAIVNLVATRLVEKSVYQQCMGSMPDKDRALVEASLNRHAARERKAGKSGW